MITNFLFYTVYRIFNGYYNSLIFLSFLFSIIVTFIVKKISKILLPRINDFLSEYYDYCLLLAIPIYILLHISKYKFNKIDKMDQSFHSISKIIWVMVFVLITITELFMVMNIYQLSVGY